MPMHMSKLDKNLAKIRSNPQAAQDFENVMAGFVQRYGEPDGEDLEMLTHIVLNEQKWWYNPTRKLLTYAVITILILGILKLATEHFQ